MKLILLKVIERGLKWLRRIFYYFSGKDINCLYDYREYLNKKESKAKVFNYNLKKTYKRALLSYLNAPLLPKPSKRNHIQFSNSGIAQCIPRALNELGYITDVINWDYKDFIVKRKYDLFTGHGGKNYEQIYRQLNRDTTSIYFSTGTYWKFHNHREEKRFEDLRKRRGVTLPFDRYIEDSEEFANKNADGIICLGNEFVRETYSKFPLVIPVNNASFPDTQYIHENKNFEVGRNNFLFFSGGGNIHKGLDLLLEAFSKIDQHLFICTTIDPLFDNLYYNELRCLSNIHLVGYTKMRSSEFFEIVDKCNYLIYPSCSEGSAGSVVECMNFGLIPILSRESGIDVKDFGVLLQQSSIEEIITVVNEVSQRSAKWCKERSRLVRKEVTENYSVEKFLQNMRKAIQTIVEAHEGKLDVQ